jgi:hypothetical protein
MLFVESIHYDYGLRGSAASRLPSSVFSSLAIHLSSFHRSTWPAPSEVANSEACASAGFRAPRWSVPGRRQLHVRGILGARHRPGDMARARGGDAWARGWEAEPPCGAKVLGTAGLAGRGGQRHGATTGRLSGSSEQDRNETIRFDSIRFVFCKGSIQSWDKKDQGQFGPSKS